jgi:hypothetical protein
VVVQQHNLDILFLIPPRFQYDEQYNLVVDLTKEIQLDIRTYPISFLTSVSVDFFSGSAMYFC